MITDEDLQRIIDTVGIVAESLDSAALMLRKMEALVPTSLEEIQDIVKGIRPLTSEAVLYIILHDTIRGVDEMGDNVRRITPDFLRQLDGVRWSDLRLDAVKQRLWRKL